jgi:predicted amidohydrolase
MDSQTDKAENLRTAQALLAQAKEQGAVLAAFPELFNVIDRGESQPEEIPSGPTISLLAEEAKRLGIWVLCGSILEKVPHSPRAKNTSVLLDPQGQVVARYSKLHLFDVTLPDGSVSRESERVVPGETMVVKETELGKLGFSICYDLRFPELFRWMALQGAEVLFLPAEFHRNTGRLHWETLLRARAIENGCYVVAPNQIGTKTTQDGPFPCYGNSMVVDPNGVVIARAGEGTGVTLAEIDLDYLDRVRQNIPVLHNRRGDIYEVTKKGSPSL